MRAASVAGASDGGPGRRRRDEGEAEARATGGAANSAEELAGSEDLPAGASTVEFRLTATEGGTRVDLCHSDLPEIEVRGHADGWANFLPRLAVVGAGGDPGPDPWQPLAD